MTGILLIDKPSGWTSSDVVAKLRGMLHEKRIGHSGTLDPMATGLLVVFVGRATRAVEFAESDSKSYIAGLRLGMSTDTQDVTGRVLAQQSCNISEAALEAVLSDFRGRISQLPPMYSAIKINGKKLYEIARKGGEVERKPRTVTISSLKILRREGEDYILEVDCSKGTYVRTLCSDIGDSIGCGGCMSALRRTRAGRFSIEDALTLDAVQRAADIGEAESLLIPIDRLFDEYLSCAVGSEAQRRLRCGNTFRVDVPDGTYRVYSQTGEFLALCKAENNTASAIKSFFQI